MCRVRSNEEIVPVSKEKWRNSLFEEIMMTVHFYGFEEIFPE